MFLEHCGTVRKVKRFANRARFLTDGKASDDGFVGFVALEECGCLDVTAENFDFEEWRAARSTDASFPTDWMAKVRTDKWEAYREVVTGGRRHKNTDTA